MGHDATKKDLPRCHLVEMDYSRYTLSALHELCSIHVRFKSRDEITKYLENKTPGKNRLYNFSMRGYNVFTKASLRQMCKQRGVPGYSQMSKDELVERLQQFDLFNKPNSDYFGELCQVAENIKKYLRSRGMGGAEINPYQIVCELADELEGPPSLVNQEFIFRIVDKIVSGFTIIFAERSSPGGHVLTCMYLSRKNDNGNIVHTVAHLNGGVAEAPYLVTSEEARDLFPCPEPFSRAKRRQQ